MKESGMLNKTSGDIFLKSIFLCCRNRKTLPETTAILHNNAVALIWVKIIPVKAKIAR